MRESKRKRARGGEMKRARKAEGYAEGERGINLGRQQKKEL